jgi:hypothetical protein
MFQQEPLWCYADANGTASRATAMLPIDAPDTIKFEATLSYFTNKLGSTVFVFLDKSDKSKRRG